VIKEAYNSGRPFQMVFCDLEMPVLGGLDATREIRMWEKVEEKLVSKTKKRFRTPIVAMTANALREDQQACFDAGMFRCSKFFFKNSHYHLFLFYI